MFRVNGLYGHIQRNAFKSVLLLLCFFGLVVVFFVCWSAIYAAVVDYWTFAPRSHRPPPTVESIWAHGLNVAWGNLWMAPLLTLIWFVNAYAFHDDIIDAETGARRIDRREAPQFYNLVENLAITAGVPMPRVQIIESPALNAYASGKSPKTASIAVTRGLLETLTERELEAVLGHEMTHIVNYDVSFMAVATVFAGGLTLVGNWIGNLFSGDRDSDSGSWGWWWPSRSSSSSDSDNAGAAALVAAVVSILIAAALLALVHLFAILIRLAISRSREYMADAGSVELTKRPDALASALQKITPEAEIPGVAPNVMAMMFCGGGTGWFDTHPSTWDRISALQTYAGATPEPAARSTLAEEPRTTFGKRRAVRA